MLQAPEVTAVVALPLQIDVEGGKIRVLRFEVFGAGIVGVAEQHLRSERAAMGNEPLKRLADPGGAHPADEVGRHLVAHIDHRQRRMVRGLPQAMFQQGLRIRQNPRMVEKIHVLAPLEAPANPQAMLPCRVEHSPVRHFIQPHRVESRRRDARKIGVDGGGPAAGKGAVGDRFQPHPHRAGPEEFSVGSPASVVGCRGHGRSIGGVRVRGQWPALRVPGHRRGQGPSLRAVRENGWRMTGP